MSKKSYSYYPGCSSQKGASADNYARANDTMCEALDIELNEIDDWNCCATSVGYSGGGELPRVALSARNIALSQKQFGNDKDIVSPCAACWLGTKEAQERIESSEYVRNGVGQALGEIGLKVEHDNMPKARHLVEVMVEDIGMETLKSGVKKPLQDIKIAGYVGCQTNRPFGIAGESYENPLYLDHMVDAMGAQPIENYEKKVACCSGALMFSEPEKGQEHVRDIIEAAYDGGADMIVTPCPLCQMNVEVYQPDINKRFGTKFNMPVVYYSQLISVAYGKSVKESGLDGQIIAAEKLNKIAG